MTLAVAEALTLNKSNQGGALQFQKFGLVGLALGEDSFHFREAILIRHFSCI